MGEFIRTSIKIPTETLIKIKTLAVRKGTSQNSIIADFIDQGLKNIEKKQGKLKTRIINDELKINAPEGYEGLKIDDLVGKFDLGHTNAVNLKKRLHEQK